MATVIATKPAPPHQKLKRPPPPAVQTSMNGVRSSQCSPPPANGAMRAPSGSKHPPSATNMNGGTGSLNSAGSRSGTRRREARTAKAGQGDGTLGGRAQKKAMQPYVKDTEYILRSYGKEKASPSLVLHLHPTHFRLDGQDGSFSYNSSMSSVLKHLKFETIPHEMMEYFLIMGVKFYEECLIVEVHDHKSAITKPVDSKAASANEKSLPFSIHNHNEHLTPSPYTPWPQPNISDAEGQDAKRDTSAVNAAGSVNVKTTSNSQDSGSGTAPKRPRIFTTVLHPTPESQQAEVAYYATTPDPKSGNRKQSSAGVPRTPASATMPHPPTPLSAVPLTPGTSGASNKKQKMLVGVNDIRNLESKIIQNTAAPLFLDPVDNLQDAQKLMQLLTDSRHKGDLPAPKTRKRTVAELAADEALAAQEQRFMLIMDERLAASASGAAGVATNSADGDGGAASFEPRFERFKLIEQIRLDQRAKKQHEREMLEQRAAQLAAEKHRQEQERHARQQQQAQQQAQQEHHAQQERAKEAMRAKANPAISQAQINAMANRQQQQQAAQQQAAQQAAHQAQTSQQPTSNNVAASGQAPHMVSASQSYHSSPVVRNNTPRSASSPTAGHVSQAGGVPMNVTSSGQGATSSPARPPSAMQHGHPGGGIQMIHQRSQQGPSRRGTPQMPNGTPSMPHATPVIPSATPTSRMGHGSPPNPVTQTPILTANAAAAAAQHMQTQNISLEQQQRIFQQKLDQQRRLAESQRHEQLRAHLAQMQNHSPQNQMSPDQRMPTPAQQMHMQQTQLSRQAYQEQIRRAQQLQMAGMAGSPQPGGGQPQPHSHPQQQPHPGAQQLQPGQQLPRGMPPQAQPQAPPPNNGQPQSQQQQQQAQAQAQAQQQQNAYKSHINLYYSQQITQRMNQLALSLGGQIPPDKLEMAKHDAMQFARQRAQEFNKKLVASRAQERNNMLAMHQAHMNGLAMGGGGAGAGAGMNGVGIPGGGMNGGMPGGGMNGMGMNGMGGVNGMQ